MKDENTVPAEGNGTTQVVWPRRTRMAVRFRFNEWKLVPWVCVTAYAKSSAVLGSPRRDVIILWLFFIVEINRSN